MAEFKWHMMANERPEKKRGNYIVMGAKGGLYFAHWFEGYDSERWFRDTRGNHHYPEQVRAWAEIPPLDDEVTE